MFDCDHLPGLPVIALDSGRQVGSVTAFLLDPEQHAVTALVLKKHNNPAYTKILPFDQVKGVGSFAVTTNSGDSVKPARDYPRLLAIIKQRPTLKGKRVITENGQLLGSVEKLFIHSENGCLEAISISGTLLRNIRQGNQLLPARHIKTIGGDSIITDDYAVAKLEAIPSKLHQTTGKVKSGTTKLWESSRRWTNKLSKTIQEITADEDPKDHS